ncbi:protein disabled [Clonorchis sinensis]|uniref:Protein disabled n=1 Tax=Clonorchis sinensis TaxID=79923 RepID=G7YJI2_CLOSI|nr:protein disabled [Clonorchis sinensis]
MESGDKKLKTTSPRKMSKDLGKTQSMSFPAKLYGQIQVMQPRGDEICEGSLALLKARLLITKNGKKQVTIEVLPSVLHIRERKVAEPIFTHFVNDITYVWTDVTKNDVCGLIVKQPISDENSYVFFGYKLKSNSAKLIGALKHILMGHISAPVDVKTGTENDTLVESEQGIGDLLKLDEPGEGFAKPAPVGPLLIAPPNQPGIPQSTQHWTRFDDTSDVEEFGLQHAPTDYPWKTPQVPASTSPEKSGCASDCSSPLPTYNPPPTNLQPFCQLMYNGASPWYDYSNPYPCHSPAFWPSQTATTGAIPSWLEYEKSTIDWVSGMHQAGKSK